MAPPVLGEVGVQRAGAHPAGDLLQVEPERLDRGRPGVEPRHQDGAAVRERGEQGLGLWLVEHAEHQRAMAPLDDLTDQPHARLEGMWPGRLPHIRLG
jgi:hypothetical protein